MKKLNRNTATTVQNNYAGSYYIFGHGGCYGDAGHCEVHEERRPYDRRPADPLTPAYKRLVVTELVEKLAKNTDTFTVTVVPILSGGTTMKDVEDVVKVDSVSIILYE